MKYNIWSNYMRNLIAYYPKNLYSIKYCRYHKELFANVLGLYVLTKDCVAKHS